MLRIGARFNIRSLADSFITHRTAVWLNSKQTNVFSSLVVKQYSSIAITLNSFCGIAYFICGIIYITHRRSEKSAQWLAEGYCQNTKSAFAQRLALGEELVECASYQFQEKMRQMRRLGSHSRGRVS
ncbi:hypothetical protein, partial [Nostoc sp. 106C]|uniref:hypothetical protein n=1 Tax=Nostoc sp. 106C TaxID=1932667 RepID=UPI000B6DFEE8